MADAIAALQDQFGDCFRVVPPDFFGYGTEELERCDQAFQDRLCSFKRHCHDKWSIGIGPDDHKEWHKPTAIREIHMDVAEVGLHPMTRWMCQWNKGFGSIPSMRLHIALDLGIAAIVLMFLAESPENLGRRMPLFGRSRLVVFENLLDHWQKRTE